MENICVVVSFFTEAVGSGCKNIFKGTTAQLFRRKI